MTRIRSPIDRRLHVSHRQRHPERDPSASPSAAFASFFLPLACRRAVPASSSFAASRSISGWTASKPPPPHASSSVLGRSATAAPARGRPAARPRGGSWRRTGRTPASSAHRGSPMTTPTRRFVASSSSSGGAAAQQPRERRGTTPRKSSASSARGAPEVQLAAKEVHDGVEELDRRIGLVEEVGHQREGSAAVSFALNSPGPNSVPRTDDDVRRSRMRRLSIRCMSTRFGGRRVTKRNSSDVADMADAPRGWGRALGRRPRARRPGP